MHAARTGLATTGTSTSTGSMVAFSCWRGDRSELHRVGVAEREQEKRDAWIEAGAGEIAGSVSHVRRCAEDKKNGTAHTLTYGSCCQDR